MTSKPSKSARKREYLALQSLGEQLIGLTAEQLESIGLDERLLEAIVAAKTINAHGALRRQKQLIGKLMRSSDPGPIREALDRFGSNDHRDKRIFREAEQWRDRVTGRNPDAVTDLFEHLGHENEILANEISIFHSANSERAQREAKRRIFQQIHKEITLKVQKTARTI